MAKEVYKTLNRIYKNGEGLSNYAFSLYLFIKKLNDRCEADNISDIFFFSREGLFLKKLYDCYKTMLNSENSIRTHYMHISRRAVTSVSLKSIEEETFKFLSGYKEITVNKFLECLNFNKDEQEILNIYSDEVYIDFDSFINSTEFEKLKNNQDFVSIYNKKCFEAKENFEAYLDKIGFESKKKIAVVDVGWNGTIQDGLSKATDNTSIKGYYLGTAGSYTGESNSKNGLLFNGTSISNPFCYKRYNYEYICVANHGATEGYDKQGEPIIIEDYDVQLYEMYFKEIQRRISEKFEAIHSAAHNIKISQLEDFVIGKHGLMLLFLPEKDKRIIKYAINNHPDNFIDIKFKKTFKYYVYVILQRFAVMASAIKHIIKAYV